MYNRASLREEFTFEEIKSTFLRSSICHEFSFALEIYTGFPVLDHSDACFVKNSNDQIQKSSAGIPSIPNPASKEMISDSVELCEN